MTSNFNVSSQPQFNLPSFDNSGSTLLVPAKPTSVVKHIDPSDPKVKAVRDVFTASLPLFHTQALVGEYLCDRYNVSYKGRSIFFLFENVREFDLMRLIAADALGDSINPITSEHLQWQGAVLETLKQDILSIPNEGSKKRSEANFPELGCFDDTMTSQEFYSRLTQVANKTNIVSSLSEDNSAFLMPYMDLYPLNQQKGLMEALFKKIQNTVQPDAIQRIVHIALQADLMSSEAMILSINPENRKDILNYLLPRSPYYVAEALISMDWDVNAQNRIGRTVLEKALLNFSAPVEEAFWKFPIDFSRKENLIKLLIAKGAVVKKRTVDLFEQGFNNLAYDHLGGISKPELLFNDEHNRIRTLLETASKEVSEPYQCYLERKKHDVSKLDALKTYDAILSIEKSKLPEDQIKTKVLKQHLLNLVGKEYAARFMLNQRLDNSVSHLSFESKLTHAANAFPDISFYSPKVAILLFQFARPEIQLKTVMSWIAMLPQKPHPKPPLAFGEYPPLPNEFDVKAAISESLRTYPSIDALPGGTHDLSPEQINGQLKSALRQITLLQRKILLDGIVQTAPIHVLVELGISFKELDINAEDAKKHTRLHNSLLKLASELIVSPLSASEKSFGMRPEIDQLLEMGAKITPRIVNDFENTLYSAAYNMLGGIKDYHKISLLHEPKELWDTLRAGIANFESDSKQVAAIATDPRKPLEDVIPISPLRNIINGYLSFNIEEDFEKKLKGMSLQDAYAAYCDFQIRSVFGENTSAEVTSLNNRSELAKLKILGQVGSEFTDRIAPYMIQSKPLEEVRKLSFEDKLRYAANAKVFMNTSNPHELWSPSSTLYYSDVAAFLIPFITDPVLQTGSLACWAFDYVPRDKRQFAPTIQTLPELNQKVIKTVLDPKNSSSLMPPALQRELRDNLISLAFIPEHIVKVLIPLGASIHSRDINHFTLVHQAIYQYFEIVTAQQLLKINNLSHMGNYTEILTNQFAYIKWLVENGAAIDEKALQVFYQWHNLPPMQYLFNAPAAVDYRMKEQVKNIVNDYPVTFELASFLESNCKK